MSTHLITTFELLDTEKEPTTKDLSAVRRQIEFVRRALSNGYLDFDMLDELDDALGKALRELEGCEGERRTAA